MPRDLSHPVNEKLRLLGLKTMLAAKLYEERLILISSENIEYPKTQLLHQILAPMEIDKLTFLAKKDVDENFKKAASNL